jgi:hypothetical protein
MTSLQRVARHDLPRGEQRERTTLSTRYGDQQSGGVDPFYERCFRSRSSAAGDRRASFGLTRERCAHPLARSPTRGHPAELQGDRARRGDVSSSAE